jgi:hypothetical protein
MLEVLGIWQSSCCVVQQVAAVVYVLEAASGKTWCAVAAISACLEGPSR